MNARKKYDVVISGIGPGGLSTAYQALTANKTVLIISDRPPGFTRTQSVLINCELREYLKNMLTRACIEEDQKFFNLLEGHLGIAIKDIERYLMRRLEELKNKIELQVIYENEIKKIDMRNGILEIGNIHAPYESREIGFTCLVGADGVGKHAYKTLAREEKIDNIDAKVEETKDLHQYNLTAYLNVRRSDNKKIKLPANSTSTLIQNNLLYGILMHRETYECQPEHLTLKPLKISFTAEIPKDIYDYKFSNQDELLNHAQQIVNRIFDKFALDNGELIIDLANPSEKYGERKDKLRLMAFEYQGSLCSTNPMYKTDTSYFIQLGDSLFDHHYQMGSGLMTALRISKLAGYVFKNELSLEEYKKACFEEVNKIITSFKYMMTFYNRNKYLYAAIAEQEVSKQHNLISLTRGKGYFTNT